MRLHYNYFRDYDPTTGRYVQSDPIGLSGGISTYGYAFANSLAFYDVLGLAPECTPWRRIDALTKTNHRLTERSFAIGDEMPGLRAGLNPTDPIDFGANPNPTSAFDRSPPMKPGAGVKFNWHETRVQRWRVQPIVEYWDVITATRACVECINGKIESWTERRTFTEDRPDLTREVGPLRYEYSSRDIGPGKDHSFP